MTLPLGDELTIDVDGCAIAARAWGAATQPSITLVHGSAAHSGWWDPMADDLATDHRVVALDLSGHGDSGWRDEYSGEAWAAEVGAVIDAFDIAPTLLVGHSLGARVAIAAAARRPDAIVGLVLLDPPVRRPNPDPTPSRPPLRPPTPAGPRSYATLDEAKMSFHLRPNEPILNRDRLLEVAAGSFKETADGWTYKADPQVHERVADLGVAQALAQIPCPALFIYGAQSPILAWSDPEFAIEAHAGPTEVQKIPDAYHHLMFDYAETLVTRIRAFEQTLG